MKRFFKFTALSLALALAAGSAATLHADNEEIFVNGKRYVLAKDQSKTKNSKTKSSKIVNKTFSVSSNFKAIDLDGIFDVVYTQSPSAFSVKGTMQQNVADALSLVVRNGTLKISYKNGNRNLNVEKTPIIYITHPGINCVIMKGTGDFKINGPFTPAGNTFSVIANGTGDFEAQTISNPALNCSIVINGTGDADIKKLTCNSVNISANGTGDAEIDLLDAKNATFTVKGTGDIEAKGAVESATYVVTSTGDIKAANLKAKTGTVTQSGTGNVRSNIQQVTTNISGVGNFNNRP